MAFVEIGVAKNGQIRWCFEERDVGFLGLVGEISR
jgi:hypothetical protein